MKEQHEPFEHYTTEDTQTDRIIVTCAYIAAIVIPLAAILILGEQSGVISQLLGTV